MLYSGLWLVLRMPGWKGKLKLSFRLTTKSAMVLVSSRRSLRKLGCSVLKVIFNHCWCRKWCHRIIQGTSLNHADAIVNFTANGAFCFCYKDVYLLIHVQKHKNVGLFKILGYFSHRCHSYLFLTFLNFCFHLSRISQFTMKLRSFVTCLCRKRICL